MDTRIPLMGQPIQVENPLNNMLRAQQIRQMQRAGEAEDRAFAQQNAMNAAWQASGGDLNKLRQNLIQGGQGSAIPGLEKQFADIAKSQASASKAGTDAILQRMEVSRQMLNGVSTPEDYMKWHLANHADPVLSQYFAQRGVTAQDALGRIQQAIQTPGGFQQLLNQSKMGLDKSMENVYQQQNMGDQGRVIAIPKNGGPASVVQGSEYTVGKNPNVSVANGDIAEQKLELERRRVAVAEQEQKRKEAGMVDLPPKTRQAREAAYPKATLALKTFQADTDKMIENLTALRDDPGLDRITGTLYGAAPGVSASAAANRAKGRLDNVLASGSLQSLQQIRASSPTGGALGNTSDADMRILRDKFSRLGQTRMDTKDYKDAINEVIDSLRNSKQRQQEAYDMDYEYRNPVSSASSESAPDYSKMSDDDLLKKLRGE